jgi:hypothetical protein
MKALLTLILIANAPIFFLAACFAGGGLEKAYARFEAVAKLICEGD